MVKQSVKHHFIPQFFLKNFGELQNNGEYVINVFNKNNLKSFHNLVSNVAYIKKFHTIKIDNYETDLFEKAHNNIYERKMSQEYAKILHRLNITLQNYCNCYKCLSNEYYDNNYLLNDDDKLFLSRLLAYFIIRGKKYRVFGEEIYKKNHEMFSMVSKIHGIKDDKKIELSFVQQMGTREDIKFNQLFETFNGDMIDKLTYYLYSHIWNIFLNFTDMEFYTNDTAHALSTMEQDIPEIYGVGYTTPGNFIIFPLTPKICIIMYDTFFIRKEKQLVIDGCFVKSDINHIKIINAEIIYSAVDEVYSKNSNWEYLKYLYKRNNIPKGHKPYRIN